MNRRAFLESAGIALAVGAGLRHKAYGQSPSRNPMRDVIVLLPGIMGSALEKDGKDVWALSGKAVLEGLRTLGGSIGTLILRDDPPDKDDIGDGIKATRILPDTHLIPGFWKIDGYSKISHSIQNNFDVTLGRNFFEFPYDWRRDNRVAARRLAAMSHRWLTSWRARSGNQQAKLVLITHSMGGLVARYFVECLDGWRDTRRLVTFGTPFRGSLNALDTLANGLTVGPVASTGLSTLTRSLTSIYQLLPSYPCYDPGTGTLVRPGEATSIPNLDSGKANRALEFHHEIDKCVQAHQHDEAYVKGLRIHPIVGAYQPTFQSARLDGTRVAMLKTYPKKDLGDGDGTVPQVSAIPFELRDEEREMYVAQLDASLQNTPVVLDQLMKVLSRGFWDGVPRASLFTPWIGLHVLDSYQVGQPVSVSATCSCSQEGTLVSVQITDAVTSREILRTTLKPGRNGRYAADFAPLPEGLYRITVWGKDSTASVTDVFVVVGS